MTASSPARKAMRPRVGSSHRSPSVARPGTQARRAAAAVAVVAAKGSPVMDGDGWTRCSQGHDHWGVYGAAGLLLIAPGPLVLLQHRASWSHHGDTWGVPGGARGSRESPVEAALREAREETGVDTGSLVVESEHLMDHGGWSYTTVLARSSSALPVHALDTESTDVRWVPLAGIELLPLHPGFGASWPLLQQRV